jgi:uncharacterized protein YegL
MSSVQLPDAADLSRRQLHLVIAVDCSGSMKGDKIASLNHALRSAIPPMQEAAAENPETDVLVRVACFSQGAHWHLGPIPVDDLEWRDLAADGPTDMGRALELIADQLTPKGLPGRQLPPVIVLITDGQPTDNFDRGLKALMGSPYGGKSLRVAIAIGADADLNVLQKFIGHPEFKPLRANNARDLVDRIKWATTAPVKTVSQGAMASGAAEALAHETANEAASTATQSEVTDSVW